MNSRVNRDLPKLGRASTEKHLSIYREKHAELRAHLRNNKHGRCLKGAA